MRETILREHTVRESQARRGGKMYARLALTGIIKNYRMYVPYLLTCICMVMMYYILLFLVESRQVAAMKGGVRLQSILSLGSGVFIIFSAIFLFYTNSFLLRSRKREFGLYNILGMEKRNLARILLWENGIVAVVSILSGLFCGILFSKLAELCMAYVLRSSAAMQFTVELHPLMKAVRFFFLIFLLLLGNALFQVGKAKPVDLLHSNTVGEKPPKANWFLAAVGGVLLAVAYYIAVMIEEPMGAFMLFFVAAGLVIAATYLIFVAGMVVLCRLLQKNKRYYYRANHFVSVSSMMYRIRRNGAGLASICILSTMVLVMLSATSCLYFGNEARLIGRFPRHIELYTYTYDEPYLQQIDSAVDSVVGRFGLSQENVLSYRYLNMTGYFEDDRIYMDEERLVESFGLMDLSKLRELYFLPVADYNRLMGKNETLGENEIIIYSEKATYEYDTFSLDGCRTWTVKKTAGDFLKNGNDMGTVLNSMYVFVPDETYMDAINAAQQKVYTNAGSARTRYYGFDLPADDEVQRRVAAQISAQIDQLRSSDEDFPFTLQNCRAAEKEDFYAVFSGMFVLGILLAIVFLAATVLIMYYKQITEGLEDQARFDIMQKVGMTDREIRSSIRSQMFTVFLLPLLLAVVHTCFAFPIVQKLLLVFGIVDADVLLLTNIACFLIFGVFYTAIYLVTSRSYYRIVKGVKA